MDTLDRIEPVARELLARVDATLVAHGAPADHPLWMQLRRVGVAPGEAVAFFAGIDPSPLRAAGSALREQLRRYSDAPVPPPAPWLGGAGEAYTAQVTALRDHQDPMSEKLAGTASYVEEVADWLDHTRAAVARTLAEVLTSRQAVAVRSSPGLDGDVAELARYVSTAVPREAVIAAADIGARVLSVAEAAQAEGHDLAERWAERLAELPFRAPVPAAGRLDATIHLRH